MLRQKKNKTSLGIKLNKFVYDLCYNSMACLKNILNI